MVNVLLMYDITCIACNSVLPHFKYLSYDPIGKFDDFKEFVESNFDMFKWIVIYHLSTCAFVFDVSVKI